VVRVYGGNFAAAAFFAMELITIQNSHEAFAAPPRMKMRASIERGIIDALGQGGSD
jgi:hypothetical protein